MNKIKYTIDDFGKDQQVNVTRKDGDMFDNNFTGIVKGIHGSYVTVEDMDGDCWDCEPDQLSRNTDEIMHGS